MIQLYYTGSVTNKGIQGSALLSLGGMISRSIVPNDEIDALFGAISQTALQEGLEEYRCLAFVNESTQSKNISLYYNNNSQSPVSSFKMGLVAPATTACNDYVFEKVPNVTSKPMISFYDNRGVQNALPFTIAPNQVLGLWIQRTVNKSQGNKFLSCDAMIERFESDDKQQVDTVTFEYANVQGTFWILNTIESSIYVSYGADNLLEDKEIISINIPENYTKQQVVQTTCNKLNSILEARGECVCSFEDDKLIITHLIPGKVIPSSPQDVPITITSIQGSSSVTEEVESLEICIDY